MSGVRKTRAVAQRQAHGKKIRYRRIASGLNAEDVAAHIGTGKSTMTAIEHGGQDVLSGTLIEVAEAVGLNVALVDDHIMPLLDLTPEQLQALLVGAAAWCEVDPRPELVSALAVWRAAVFDTPVAPPAGRMDAAVAPAVAVDQVWSSKDRRGGCRLVRVEWTDGVRAVCVPVLPDGGVDASRPQSRVRVVAGGLDRHTLVRHADGTQVVKP
ncbi:helix-turn-helix domain-containing protein [Micromonospora sediminicola]|uniref:helix-turn-helix domain-containing protein n=1 Tax=Micromonospora sediminicola TaxID=946078 RepID=UPI0037A9D50B